MTANQTRVQIPAYTDRWMMGDCYGTIVKVTTSLNGVHIAHVRLDKSGKVIKCVSEDCADI
jgi:hypothetical protein